MCLWVPPKKSAKQYEGDRVKMTNAAHIKYFIMSFVSLLHLSRVDFFCPVTNWNFYRKTEIKYASFIVSVICTGNLLFFSRSLFFNFHERITEFILCPEDFKTSDKQANLFNFFGTYKLFTLCMQCYVLCIQ